MEFEDSRNAIFCDPNAYVHGMEHKEIKKVVFAEPYDCLPTFYIDNNFKKHNCDCIPKPPKPPCVPQKPKPCVPQMPFNFDFKSMMPILLGLLNKGGGDMAKLLTNFTNQMPQNLDNAQTGQAGFNMQTLIENVMKSPKMLEGVMSLFKGGGLKNLFNKKQKNTSSGETKQTDHVIKNYTRVET